MALAADNPATVCDWRRTCAMISALIITSQITCPTHRPLLQKRGESLSPDNRRIYDTKRVIAAR
jgi:hypothetical protein